MGSESRKRSKIIMVRVSDTEYDSITDIAQQCDLTTAALLRELGLGHQPDSKIDLRAIETLAKLHGDMGRVGGLLKMWLSSKEKQASAKQLKVDTVVHELIELKNEIANVVRQL